MKKNDIYSRRALNRAAAIFVVLGVLVFVNVINIPPAKGFGGAYWFKNGFHYLNAEQLNSRISEINQPYEQLAVNKVTEVTQACEKVDYGFCKQEEKFFVKTLLKPAVQYVPGTPSRKEVVGYCTLCNDSSFSPSCAVGRGACSWHGGVAAYNVPRYREIPGSPAIEAQDAVYDYATRTYKDSPNYVAPPEPSLSKVVGYKQ